MFEVLHNLLYIFQLEEYDPSRFRKWAKSHRKLKGLEKKKKLAWTIKARALFILGSIFNLLTFGKRPALALILASCLLSPFEKIATGILVFLAKIKIKKMKNLKVVGITGSFGKTSTKEILAKILEKKFKVLKTPQSYNTPLGIAKVILCDLSSRHEVFIVEMGAYKVGDVEKLCHIVKPTIGVLTGINFQHLERFGSFKNIVLAKSELVWALPDKGLAILNFDSPSCRNLVKKIKVPFIFYSLSEKPKKGRFLAACDIRPTPQGTRFTLLTSLDQKEDLTKITTPLLGRHNVLNILASIGVTLNMGVDIQEIKDAVKNLTPIPHRLQIIKTGETIILDDAYNANPEGVKAALEVLKLFKQRPKIVVTPGLVELGKKQYEENFKIGKLLGQVCDLAIVVGKTNKKALISGISLFKELNRKVFWVKDLKTASSKLRELAISNSIILFENDLPDQYD